MASAGVLRLPWYFCSDHNHLPLAQQLLDELESGDSPFEPRFIRADNLGGLPGRAAGGLPVQDFKLRCILETCLAQVEPGEYFVWSDVDVQPTAPLQAVRDALESLARADAGIDVHVQREFEDFGCNVGFMLVRSGAAARRLFERVGEEMRRSKRLDQKV